MRAEQTEPGGTRKAEDDPLVEVTLVERPELMQAVEARSKALGITPEDYLRMLVERDVGKAREG